MELREIIKKILKEETSKDLTNSIKKLIERYIDTDYTDIICDIKVLHPKDRKVLKFQTEPYTNYRVDIIFKGDPLDTFNSNQIIEFENISDKLIKIIYNFIGVEVALFYKIQEEC